jgi:hypothetical protein
MNGPKAHTVRSTLIIKFDGKKNVEITPADNKTCIRWSQGAVGGSEHAKRIDLALFMQLLIKALFTF